MPLMETIIIASLTLGGIRAIWPDTSQKATLPTTTIPATPNTSILHATNTDGDGANAVFNVSFVNNNGNTPPKMPPTTFESAQEYFKKNFNTVHLSDLVSTACQYCAENKYYLTVCSAAGMGGYLYYKIRAIQRYIDTHTDWSAWKRDTSLEVLLTIPQDHLTRELMTAIQERYISTENPTDSLTPLISFANDIATEKELLAEYHDYIAWCSRFSIHKIIPFSQTLLAQITERKQRVAYLSTLFQSWLAHYKLEQINRARSTYWHMSQLAEVEKILDKKSYLL